ncbi:thioredoxin family protein [Flavobacterium sp.]|uniref:thioredoxin family protein n=1 Tax=Flavobacterium sp. TaxID=239 RepID=UPI002614D643|nr:thioredoxin family protein [Flavobacterium sp.]MDD2985052.1 thioredoxin family protein [Flavobacterium sp.]
MKKLVFILVFFWTIQSVGAQELTWQTDINKAIELSAKSKKPLMLFFTGSDWCGWCIKLQKEVFMKPEFVEWANKVILVELDFPRKMQLEEKLKQQNQQLQQIFQVQGYPTIWFVNPQKNGTQINLEQLGKTGYVAGGPEKFLEVANQFLPK